MNKYCMFCGSGKFKDQYSGATIDIYEDNKGGHYQFLRWSSKDLEITDDKRRGQMLVWFCPVCGKRLKGRRKKEREND